MRTKADIRGTPCRSLLRAMLLALFACWSLPRGRAGERAGHQPARHRVAGLRCRRGRTGSAFPRRPAAAVGARLAYLLAEPRRCRRAPGAGSDLPPGATAGPIAWPAPQRVAEGPLMTYAYTGDVLLPVTVTPASEGGTGSRRTRTGWCASDICVPEEGDFRLDLPVGAASTVGAGAAVRGGRPAGAARLALARGRSARTGRCSCKDPS